MRKAPGFLDKWGIARFELITRGSRPKLQRGQMTIVYEAIERLGRPSLADLVQYCRQHGHCETFRNPGTNLAESVVFHLKRLEEGTIGKSRGEQAPVIRIIQN
jgi:hypothetical protein